MSKPLSIRVRVALQRARMVARGDLNRSVQILLDERVAFAAAVRFSIAAACIAAVTACGGGGNEPQTAAEAAALTGTQPVNCTGVVGLQCQ